jgi:hypothetical protein
MKGLNVDVSPRLVRSRVCRFCTRISIAIAIGACALGASSPAGAFCRSTTCLDDSCPRDENGCKTTGFPLQWASLCVGFSVQQDGTANLPLASVRTVIQAGFFAWSGLMCGKEEASIAFSELADVSCHTAQYNPNGPNANIILFQDNKWIYTGINDTLAKTTVSFDSATGEILDADIELNSAYNDFTIGDDHVVYDLQSILTHEIGHFIGLDHSLDPDATMNANYDMGTTTLRTLAPDDVAAACAAYPPSRPGRCGDTPHGGFASECASVATAAPASSGCSIANGDETSASALGMVAFAAALFARRRSPATSRSASGGAA